MKVVDIKKGLKRYLSSRMNNKGKFIKDSSKKAFDINHRNKLKYNILQYFNAFEKGTNNYQDLELAKEYISKVKKEAVDNLSELLISFENEIASRGTQVLWALDKNEALQKVENILKKHAVKMLVKSKSMISEELDLNDFLEKKGIEPVETDLGEFIVQLEGETPYHILTPAIHKSKEDVAQLFSKKFGTDPNETPHYLTTFTREKLREKYVTAGAGITGANFLVADVGAVALTENEGNGIMTVAFPKVHIVIAGVEKVIPKLADLGKVWPVLAQFGTGQQSTVYNSIFTGPRKEGEQDGPEFMYVILLDNGRGKLAQIEPQNEALKCIRCGACLNVCPIYRNVGGHTYNTPYSGPIGSVITPIFRGAKFNHMADACSLCGKCTETCPAKIPLHELILENRAKENDQKCFNLWALLIQGFQIFNKNQNKTDIFPEKVKKIIFSLVKNNWGTQRSLPRFKKETFSKYWSNQKLNN